MRWPWQKKETRDNDPSWAALIPSGTSAGLPVSPGNAETISTVFSCVQSIAETIGGLPLLVYRQEDNGDRVRASDHSLYRVLHDQPNERQTALEFREQLTAHVLLWGNGYAEIKSDAAGNVTSLEPIHPQNVTVLKLPSGRIRYDVADPTTGKMRALLADEVLHLKDRTDNGIVGKSRIQVAREMLGGVLASQEHGNKAWANGARLSGVLQTDNVMTNESIGRLRESWEQQFSGYGNTGKTAILENGLKYAQLSMSNEDAQWLESRQFSVEEICRIFRVPPVLVADLRHANFSNSVEMNRWFVTHTLRRWLTMWEEGCERALLGPIARKRFFVEHNVEGLLRGDSTGRAAFYQSGIAAGWLLKSEARTLENLPALEGIDDAAQADAA
ncbi:phage portal protein [Luteimonas lutimaris]|uniref:Phage portal protein n=1 Tax=Luteimonas lutimaris TaxID=698645 RepID=A0ABP7MTL6_9GAMM